ncbi:cytochrome P450 [Cylindrobasidium torrendii FP15055 ss-10]|uniref:Cytochrome P450 n=1 Tax=Cylindrobasidium torrendii FP15055 ss-10 TaxID=1314674 RepID=A0A0D7B8T3_9AGAR|nr:cytochrome P450 [Cylindrobasidium torrendii FP15055 ss-10]
MSWLYLVAFLFLAVLIVWSQNRQRRRPPGPRGLPIVGNLFDLPTGRPWEGWAALGAHYGPLMSFGIGPTTIVIINSYEKARDVLKKKGNIYSSRPHIPMAELAGWTRSTALMESGAVFKRVRQMYHAELGTIGNVDAFAPQQEIHGRSFLRALQSQPEDLEKLCLFYTGSLLARITYGHTVTSEDDEVIVRAHTSLAQVGAGTTPGAFWVNHLPFLRYIPEWIPGTGFKQAAKVYKKYYEDTVSKPVERIQRQVRAGTAEASFCAKSLMRGLSKIDVSNLMFGASTLFGAGIDTTAITLHCFFLMMLLHPDVQQKVQREVEFVCGAERLPNVSDREKLPYLKAVIKEIIRIHTPAPTGLPHTNIEDDVHDGYFIPKGSMIIANIWQLAHDDTVYTDPFTFNPERFIGPNPEQDPYDYVFGFGRRVCPGQLLAEATLNLACAMVLSVFDILPALDAEGKPVIPVLEALPGISSSVKSFKYVLKKRVSDDVFDTLLGGEGQQLG